MSKKITTSYYNLAEVLSKKGMDIPLLALRIILAYAFLMPALTKWSGMEGTIYWFGEVLNMPLPAVMAYTTASVEMLGVFLLLLGLGTRIISIPLIIVMLVAIFTVHIANGWPAIASSANNPEVAERLNAAKEILKSNGNYEWLTNEGNFVILNNGVEFPVIYIVMLLILMTAGAGRISLDSLIDYRIKNKSKD